MEIRNGSAGPVELVARIRLSRPDEAELLYKIWADAVDATHQFLRPGDHAEIVPLVKSYVTTAPLWIAASSTDRAMGFMGLSEKSMDSLFIDPAFHRQGIGRLMVGHALTFHDILDTDVNEQNHSAVQFYERMGFVRTGRSELDTDGRPYPLIYMRLERRNWCDAANRPVR
jgi:putative acetyltransferase